jgi:hypothetical protein
MKRIAVCTTLAAVVLQLASAGAAALDRSLQDRPDEQLGPQVHLIYATPADGSDRAWDTNGRIASSVSTWNAWFRQQADGAAFRIDTLGGEPDISFVRLGRTNEQVIASDPYYSIVGELRARGFDDRSKVYSVYYEGEAIAGTAGVCGYGLPPFAINYLGDCGGTGAMLRPDAFDLGILHELLHAFGVVPACAPHQSGFHVWDDNRDLMYSGGQDGPKDWPNMTIDPGRDDYFGHSIPSCPDLADSDFLTTHPFYRVTFGSSSGGSVTAVGQLCRVGQRCSHVVRGGTEVTLVANPRAGYRFVGWSRPCGRVPTCRLTVSSTTSATATFKKLNRLRLSVTGPGLVRVSPGNRTCRSGRTCVLPEVSGTRLTLRAVPSKGARVLRWQGGRCSGSQCVLRLDSDRAVRVAFSR